MVVVSVCVGLQISDKNLIDLIRRKVKLNQPYAGVFLKRDDEYDTATVTRVSQLIYCHGCLMVVPIVRLAIDIFIGSYPMSGWITCVL